MSRDYRISSPEESKDRQKQGGSVWKEIQWLGAIKMNRPNIELNQ